MPNAATNVVRRSLPYLALAIVALPLSIGAQTLKPRILQTNGAGDTISVIDPATDKVIGEITGIEQSHGVQASADGSRIFVTCEDDATVVAIDGKTLKEIKRIPLSGGPHNLAFVRGVDKVYVGIHGEPGGLDVIDAKTLTKIKHIPLKGMPIHNPYATPDGKFVVANTDGEEKIATVIDAKTDETVWTLTFDRVVRPTAFSTNPDGSTKWAFFNLAGMSGFAVVDWATRKEIRRIETPWAGGNVSGSRTTAVPSHGIGVTPDNSSVWVNSRTDNSVYVYSLPDLKLLGYVPVQFDPMWMTFTPDSKKVYVANNGAGTVSVIDTKTRKIVALIPVGQAPKRNATAMLPH